MLWLAFGILGSAQEETLLEWSPDIRLTWDDFKDTPDSLNTAAAITASGISYRFKATMEGNETVLDFTVSTYFYPEQSWYKPELCDTAILGHEQLHFDISELFARKMRKKLTETSFTEAVKKEIKTIYKETLDTLHAYQLQYDAETDYSRNRGEQYLWELKVTEALETKKRGRRR